MHETGFHFDLADETQTTALAAAVATIAARGSEIHLVGPLAAGKTAFARGFLRALGHHGTVKSPTFTIVETYADLPGGDAARGPLHVHHFDLYRLADEEELDYLGFEDYRQADAILLIEWPSRAPGRLAPSIRIELAIAGPEARRAVVSLLDVESRQRTAEFEKLVRGIKRIAR